MSGHSSNAPQAGDIQEPPAPRRIRSEVRRSDQRALLERSASGESQGPARSTQISRLIDAYGARLHEQRESSRRYEAENARLKRRLERLERELRPDTRRRLYRTPSPQASKSRSRGRSPRQESQKVEGGESDDDLREQLRGDLRYQSPARSDENIRNLVRREMDQHPAHQGTRSTRELARRALKTQMKSPLTREIEEEEAPNKFFIPRFKIYDGKTDPIDHIRKYRQAMTL